MSVIHWPEIALFHNVRKYTETMPDILMGGNQVTYRPKIKLHGANCAIQCHNDGKLVPQSRTTELSPENDFAGFAKWARETEGYWKSPGKFHPRNDVVVYGEWIGKGINKDAVAVSSLPNKVFAVFAAKPLYPEKYTPIVESVMRDGKMIDNPDFAWSQDLIIEPLALEALVHDIPDTYVLPWYSKSFVIDWSKTDDGLADVVAQINDWVHQVELVDPWVKSKFNIDGTGEGLVFYPMSKEHVGAENFGNLAFKAKGEKHRVVKTKEPVQVSATAAASIDQFVDLVLTDARLEQGANAVGGTGFDKKLVGKFLAWVSADVEKETQDELQASNLTWKQVQKAVSERARTWYLGKAK